MPKVAFIGRFPQFPVIAALLRQAGITASRGDGLAALYVSDAEHAPALLDGRRCIVVSEDRSAGTVQRWLDAGAAGVLGAPLVAPAVVAGIRTTLSSRFNSYNARLQAVARRTSSRPRAAVI